MTETYTSDVALRATVLEILAPRRGEYYRLTTGRLVDKVAHALIGAGLLAINWPW